MWPDTWNCVRGIWGEALIIGDNATKFSSCTPEAAAVLDHKGDFAIRGTASAHGVTDYDNRVFPNTYACFDVNSNLMGC